MTIMPLKQRTNNMFWINFKLSLKQNKKMLIVISILQMLGLPMLSVLLTAVAIDEESMSEISIGFFAMISLFCIAVSIFCGIIIAVNNFSYLHKKSQVDMIYSLPIKRKYKFISDFFSGLAVYLIPYIAACILSWAILLASGVCVKNISGVLENGSFVSLIIQGEFAGLLIMALLYTLTVLVLNCCGTLFESIINILIINILIPGLIAVIATMFFAQLYGVSIFDTILPVLGYTSPIGAGIYLIYLLASNEYTYSGFIGCISAGAYGKWVVFFLLFTAAVFALSMFLYLKRKAEDVSKPYVYKLLYYLVITSVLMAISLIARYDITTIIPVIIFSLIVYLIFEVITNRGFKKIYKSFIRYAVTMVSILIVCIIAVGTKGFGVESKIPSVNSVKNVRVSYQGFDQNVISGYHIDYLDKKFDRVYTEKQIIEKVIEVHKDALDLYNSGEFEESFFSDDYYYSDSYDSEIYYDGNPKADYPRYKVNFTYKLKTGSSITRRYTLTYEQISQLFILDLTPQMGEFLEKCIFNNMKYIEYINNKRTETFRVYLADMLNENSYEYKISKAQAKEICEAYGKDYVNMSEKQMLTDSIYCYINGDYPVRESFKNTIALLEKYMLEVPEITVFDYLSAVLYPPEALKCWGSDESSASFGSMYLNQSEGRILNFEQFESMLELGMIRAPYYEEADCWCVNYNGSIYIIPSEFSDNAETMYNRLSETGVVVTKEILIEDLRNSDEDISYIIQKYGIDDDAELYDEFSLLQELSYKYYDEYSSFDEYFESMFGTIDENSRDEYNYEKLHWNYWKSFNKFYGYATLEDYIEFNSIDEKDEVSLEWTEYTSAFPSLNARLFTSFNKQQ